MRRLFSSFARGWPGVGLLLLRGAAGFALIHFGFSRVSHGVPMGLVLTSLLAIASGLLLAAGLWTPIAGGLVAILALFDYIWRLDDPWLAFLVGSLGGALALLGPGSWSVDARLFGWKRLDIRIRER